MHLQALYPDSRSVLVPVIISHNQSDSHELSKIISRPECDSVRRDSSRDIVSHHYNGSVSKVIQSISQNVMRNN